METLITAPATLALIAEGESPFGGILLPMLLMFGVIYFIVLRPMSKQEKDRQSRVTKLQKGDQVVIGGGIIGRISNWDDPTVAVVEIADKVKVRVMKKDIVDTKDAAIKAAEQKSGRKPKDQAKDGKGKDGEEARKGA